MNIEEIKTMTESELRDVKVPFFKTIEELTEFVETLAQREHDYGTCVYAMSLSAQGAFNYIAHVLGVTGFQASCAELSFWGIGSSSRSDDQDSTNPRSGVCMSQVEQVVGCLRPFAGDVWGSWH